MGEIIPNFDFGFMSRKKQERYEGDAMFLMKQLQTGVQGPATPEQEQAAQQAGFDPQDMNMIKSMRTGEGIRTVPQLSTEAGGAKRPLPGQAIEPGQDEGLAAVVDPGVLLTDTPQAAGMGAKLAAKAGVKAGEVAIAAGREALAQATAGVSEIARVGVRALANERGSVPIDPFPNEMGKHNPAKLNTKPDVRPIEEATKVVDKEGKPLAVYHGTGRVFDEFDPTAATQNGKSLGQGIYFTESAESASKYAAQGGDAPNVRQVFLDIRKPFDMSKKAKPELAGKVANDFQQKITDPEAIGKIRTAQTNEELYNAIKDVAGEDRANRILKAYGFDGIKDQSTWVAFDASQVKNAIGAKAAQAQMHNPVDVAFDAVDNVNDVKTAIQNVAVQLAKETKKSPLAPGAKPLPDPFVDSIAQTLGVTHDDVLDRLRGAGLDVEHIRAYGMLYAKAKTNLEEVAQAVDAGYLKEDEIYKALGRFQLFHSAVFGAGTELGQSLRMFQADDFKNTKTFATELQKQLADLQGAVPNGKTLAQMVKVAGTETVARTAISASELGNDMWKELLYFTALSNPRTNIVNVASGAFLNPFNTMAQRYLQEKFGGGYVKAGETAAMFRAFTESYSNAIRSVMDSASEQGWWATIRSAKSIPGFAEDVSVKGPAITGENVGKVAGAMAKRLTPEFVADPKDVDLAFRSMFGDTLLGKFTDGIGELVHYPLAALRVGDRFSKSINFDMEARAQAIRHGFMEAGEMDPATVKAAVDKALQAPGLGVRESAEALAAVNTFTNELKYGVPGILNHPVVKTQILFYQTPANIFKYNLAHTPVLGLALQDVRADIAAGGLKREAALTRMAMGSIWMGGVAALAKSDVIEITGRGPDNPNTRAVWAKDNQEYSIKIKVPGMEPKWIGLGRVEPFGTWLGMAADMVNMSGDVAPEDMGEVAAAAVASFGRNFTNKTFTYSAFEFLNILNVKNYEEVDSLDQRLQDFAAKRLANFTPAIETAVARSVDPTLRQVKVHGDAMQTLLNRIKSKTPGWSKDLPAELDMYGDTREIEGGWATQLFSPFNVKSFNDDPNVKEIVRTRANFPQVPYQIDGVALTPQERHDWQLAWGKADFGEGDMRTQLATVRAGRDYIEAPTDAFRAKLLEGVGRGRLNAAKALIMQEGSELFSRVYGGKMKKIEEIMGPQGAEPVLNFHGNPLFK